ncbi:RNA binding protein, putative [Brugia malayi]|uniref:Bm5116 n=1 Tax=Brugia malayi TaxID=6279 RepID=A0A0K0JHL4_BRUMA|nr:RNA binding protein, putative [Brugia malayi]CRZ23765.1 Bm5116 [Brugia malayi]VIO85981.1 RNA binding protein, putative [Brugia malayi]
MSLINLSLDEIIARQRGANKKPNSSSSRSRNSRKKRSFVSEYPITHSSFTRPEDVPSGKWDHSGFEEMYGNRSDDLSPHPGVQRGARFNRVDLTKKVRLHITNLAPTVNSADLDELFEKYSVISVNVNYDEMGASVGTADVVTDRVSATEIVANLNGVALDGKVMSFHMIDDQTVPASRHLRIKNRLGPRERSWNITKKQNLPSKRKHAAVSIRHKIGTKRWQMTDEELDRELEEYMNKRNYHKQDEQKMEI